MIWLKCFVNKLKPSMFWFFSENFDQDLKVNGKSNMWLCPDLHRNIHGDAAQVWWYGSYEQWESCYTTPYTLTTEPQSQHQYLGWVAGHCDQSLNQMGGPWEAICVPSHMVHVILEWLGIFIIMSLPSWHLLALLTWILWAILFGNNWKKRSTSSLKIPRIDWKVAIIDMMVKINTR